MTDFIRPAHFLRRNQGCRVPVNHVALAIDTGTNLSASETTSYRYMLKYGTAKHFRLDGPVRSRITECYVTDPLQIRAFLLRHVQRRSPLWVWSHDMPLTFALIGGWEWLRDGTLLMKCKRGMRRKFAKRGTVAISPDRTGFISCSQGAFIVDCFLDGCRIVFVSLENWRDGPLQVIDSDSDASEIKPGERLTEFGTEYERCDTLCNATIRAITEIVTVVTNNDLGNFAPTLSSQAMRAFRHRWMDHAIHIHGHRESLALERHSYRGGRSEAFFYGKTSEGLYRFDVNGLYAHWMLHGEYPYEILDYQLNPEPQNLRIGNGLGAIAHVMLDFDGPFEYPVLTRDAVSYARGRFATYLAGLELRQALTLGHVRSVYAAAIYKTAPLFKRLVLDCWGLRLKYLEQGNHALASYFKRLVNGLYGRWGQRGLAWSCTRAAAPPGVDCEWFSCRPGDKQIDTMRAIADVCQIRESGPEGMESFPAIAAYITSYARLAMDTLRAIAGDKHVYLQYVDTLVVDQEGFDRLEARGNVIGPDLGQLRLIDSSIGADFYSAHDWVWRGRPIVCGVPSSAGGDYPGQFRFMRRESIDDIKGAGHGAYLDSVPIEIVLNRAHPQGRVGTDGWLAPVYLGV